MTQVSDSARPRWHRAGAGVLASLLWLSSIAIAPQRAARDAGTLAAGKVDVAFWLPVLPFRVSVGIQAAMAAPIADPNAPIEFQPKIWQSTDTRGAVPVVNITAPNGAGISLNKSRSFNVDAVGLILNNSLITGTALTGGTIQANGNLNGRTASIILNEVTSLGAGFESVLNGPLEVFGAPATVIIANPNGIAVRGASFTNTIGVTLSTGVPSFIFGPLGAATTFDNGAAIRYDVTGGHIQIDGNPTSSGPATGIEGTVGNIDLIGETIGIHAPLYVGNTINLVAGRQVATPSVITATGNAYATSANGSTNTAAAIDAVNGPIDKGYAIDASAFGTVTAGKIQVISTAAGMGVRADSQLAAHAGDVTISANGDVSIAGSLMSAYGTSLSAGRDVALTGVVNTRGAGSISAGRDFYGTGSAAFAQGLTATSGRDTRLGGLLQASHVNLQAGNDATIGTVESTSTIHLAALGSGGGGTLTLNGTAGASGSITTQAAKDTLIKGKLAAGSNTSVVTKDDLYVAGAIEAYGDTVLRAIEGSLSTTGGINSGGALAISTALDLSLGASTTSVSDMTLAAGRDALLNGMTVGNTGGTIAAGRDIGGAGTLAFAHAALNVTTGGTFANDGQVIANHLTLNGALRNAAGALFYANDVLALNGNVTNRGTVEAGTLNVNGGYYDNRLGQTQSVGAMTFTMGGGTLQNTGGKIVAGTNLAINAGAVIDDQTAPSSGATTTTRITDPSLLMSGVVGTKTIAYSKRTGNNFYVTHEGRRSATLGDLLSPTGTTTGITIGYNCVAGCTQAASAPVAQAGAVSFSPSTVKVGQSSIGIGTYQRLWSIDTGAPGFGGVTLTLPNQYETVTTQKQGTSGVISAGGSISLTADSLSNRGGQISAQDTVAVNVQSLSNGAVAPTSTQQITRYVDQAQYTAFLSRLSALGTVYVKGTGNPTGIYCGSGGCTTLSAIAPIKFTIHPSAVAPSQSGTTTASGAVGMIVAGSHLSIAGGKLVNAGLLHAGNDVSVTAQSLSNRGEHSQNTVGHRQSEATIFAGHDLVIAAGDVSNTDGNLIAGHDIVVGGVGTTGTSSALAQSLTNISGNVVAGNDITLNVSGAMINTLPPPTLVHENFGSSAQYSGCMTAGGYKNGYCEAYVEQQPGGSSTISAGNHVSVQAGTLTNIGSLITAGTSATIHVQGPIVNRAQTLNAYWHSHWTQETGLFSADKTHDTWACGSAAACAQIYGSAYTGGAIDPPTPIGNIAGTIQAPNLNITSGGQIQNVGNILGTQVSLTGHQLINGITTANTYTPYLPSGAAALTAGGNIEGNDVALNFDTGSGGSIENTGRISASDTLTVNTDSLTNRANQVNVGDIWNNVDRGYTDTTGTTVQPGGFMSAANLDLNVQTLAQIGGALQKLSSDGTVDQAGTAALIAGLQARLGSDFTLTSLSDQLNTNFVKRDGGLPSFVIAAIAVAASLVTAGAAAAAMASMTLAESIAAAALSGMAGSTASQVASGDGVDFGAVLKAGAIAAVTAGLTNGITFNTSTGELGLNNLTQGVDSLPQNTQTLRQLANLSKVGNTLSATVTQAAPTAALRLPTEWAAMAATAALSASVQTAIGGGSFLSHLRSAAEGSAAAASAFAIGNEQLALIQDFGKVGGELAYVGAHAALGCALGVAEGTGCASSAIGGATSAFVTPFLLAGIDPSATSLTTGQAALATALAMLAGGAVGTGLGLRSHAAAAAALNEAINNSEGHVAAAIAQAKSMASSFWNAVTSASMHASDKIVAFEQAQAKLAESFAPYVPVALGGVALGVAAVWMGPELAAACVINTPLCVSEMTILAGEIFAGLNGMPVGTGASPSVGGTSTMRSAGEDAARGLKAKNTVSGADGAANAANGKRLNNQLAAEEIAKGHAFDKHVIEQNEFRGSITTQQQFADQIENILKHPSATKQLLNGRSAYWDDASGVVVIRNPGAPDGGTAFKPTNGKAYFNNLR